jgi:hypothetical protein
MKKVEEIIEVIESIGQGKNLFFLQNNKIKNG